MAIRTDGAEPALQGRSLRAARTQCSSSEPTILQPFDQFAIFCDSDATHGHTVGYFAGVKLQRGSLSP